MPFCYVLKAFMLVWQGAGSLDNFCATVRVSFLENDLNFKHFEHLTHEHPLFLLTPPLLSGYSHVHSFPHTQTFTGHKGLCVSLYGIRRPFVKGEGMCVRVHVHVNARKDENEWNCS